MRELLALLFLSRSRCSTKVHLKCVTYRTILPWMAQETQYCSLRYILGTVYSGNTDASEISPVHDKLASAVHTKTQRLICAQSSRCSKSSLPPPVCFPRRCPFPLVYITDYVRNWYIRIAADSTMFLMVNLLIALSLGVHREQLEHRMGFTCPRPFLFLPLLARFLTILADSDRTLVRYRRNLLFSKML